MTSGRELIGVVAAFAMIFGGAVPAWPQQPESGLTALMNSLHQVRDSSARFVETKYLRVLNQAQETRGRLVYVAPDRLWKETTQPAAARMTAIGDRLTIERQGEKTLDLSLRDYTAVGSLVESVRATLAGDLATLTRYFNPTFQGSQDNWLLILKPKEAKLRELVTSIRIKGERTAIRDIETIEADGDRTDMAIIPDPR